ncbi:hypothetical protein EV175_001547 [Coemansia sp. RSA 1933]|nr:hypothetical protein EV175_001547 [Coemansia sp. RSA 1933]
MNLVSGRVLIPTIDPGKLAASNEKYRDIIELSREGISIHNIAYVAQESWLRNATIRENILFGEAYDKDRYEEVLNVCALKPDLRILVAGDMTEIGERGVTLSGGQKQRVALARAVYSSRQILLIDDCLFYDSTPIGRIINRFSRDMATVDGYAVDSIVYWFAGISTVLAVNFVVSAAIPAFLIAAILITGSLLMIAFYYLNTSREIKRLESNGMSPLLSLFGELIQGVTTIRAFGAKKYYIKEAINRISAQNRPYYAVWAANRWLAIRVDTVSALVSATTAMFIILNIDWMDAGMAGFILSYAMSFSNDMLWVICNYSANEMNMNSVERIMQYLKVEQEAALESTPENKPSAMWPQKGDVWIENLVVEYTPGVPVLHDISLSAKHGERIGVVGRTGAGKSTMSLALLRFIEASKGRIVLDGIDISKIGLEDLRRNVTIIPQDPVLFNGTIRFNLDPFDEYPDELLWEALRRTHLVSGNDSQASSSPSSVSEGPGYNDAPMVERMSGIFKRLDAEIKENGQNLSLGQRQLVSLARALIRRSKLIIMDEATASVDFDTDHRLQRTIRGPEFANSTLFCIAHRLRTVIDYDRVIVLENGKVAEFDTPYNLLQNEDGIFKSMCEDSGEYERLCAMARSKQN